LGTNKVQERVYWGSGHQIKENRRMTTSTVSLSRALSAPSPFLWVVVILESIKLVQQAVLLTIRVTLGKELEKTSYMQYSIYQNKT
jgi:hypothetical protein